jgi:hypothetical protein
MALTFFTIGHSTRSIGEFIELLVASKIGVVVDVRTVPRSRTNPQYNRDALPASLSGFQIAYEHIAELGGLRPRSRNVGPAVNVFWENQSFHNYADYAMSAGGDLVAVSSPDHHRLFAGSRRTSVSYHGAGQDRSSNCDESCKAAFGRNTDLSGDD